MILPLFGFTVEEFTSILDICVFGYTCGFSKNSTVVCKFVAPQFFFPHYFYFTSCYSS